MIQRERAEQARTAPRGAAGGRTKADGTRTMRVQQDRRRHSTRGGLRVVTVVALVVLAMAGGRPAQAQSKTGTTIGQFLLIEPSARASAMGNAGVTMIDEVSGAFYNPGVLGHLPHSDVQFTYSSWLAGVTYNYAAVAVHLGDVNTLLVTVASLNSGNMAVRTVDQPEGTGEKFDVTDLAIGVGYGRRITNRFSGGIQAKYMQETIWHSSLNAIALDVGVFYELPFRAYLGASISNFGSEAAFDGRDLRVRFDQDVNRFGDNSNLPANLETEKYALPILFRVGLGIPVQLGANNVVHLAVDAFQPNDNLNSVSVGGEWIFHDLLSLRAGMQNLFLDDAEAGMSLGAGLQFDVASYGGRFDYAWSDFGRLEHVQRFTVGFSF